MKITHPCLGGKCNLVHDLAAVRRCLTCRSRLLFTHSFAIHCCFIVVSLSHCNAIITQHDNMTLTCIMITSFFTISIPIPRILVQADGGSLLTSCVPNAKRGKTLPQQNQVRVFLLKASTWLLTAVGSTVFIFFHLQRTIYHHGQGRPRNSQAAKESQKACSKGSIQRQRTAAASSITIAAIVQDHTESTSTCKRSIGIVHCHDVQRKYSMLWEGDRRVHMNLL